MMKPSQLRLLQRRAFLSRITGIRGSASNGLEDKNMWQSRLIAVSSFILAASLSAPTFGANPARPGSINYVEGQASIAGQTLDSKSIGSAELQPGQTLDTQVGKAEILLTPGAFLRAGDNSSVTMISPNLTDTELRLDKGRATVEVAELHEQNNLIIVEHGDTVRLLKTGLYEFDADQNLVRVYQGKADVREMNRDVEVKGKHQVSLGAGGLLKAQKFDIKKTQDDLYRWSSLRSSYDAEANIDQAQAYAMSGWYGSAWAWDPYFGGYTYIPGNGIFYSSFGWGFYSPFSVYYAPIPFYGHYYHHFGPDWHRWGGGEHYFAHYDHGFYRGSGGYYGHSGYYHGADRGTRGYMGQGGHEHFGAGGSHQGGGFHGGGGGHSGGGGGRH
jgi:hypothetical protein